VPYELFIKLPPCVKTLICEAQKAEPGYQDEANIDDSDAGNQRVLLAHVMQCKVLPCDIQWVLAAQ